MARSIRRLPLPAVLALAVFAAPCGAAAPGDDPGTRVLAGLIELVVANDSAAAYSYLMQHAEAGADRTVLTMDMRNLLREVRRRGPVRPERIYRVGQEVFALLEADDGSRFQVGVEISADATITAFRYVSGWWSPPDLPIVLGSGVLNDSHWTGIPPDLASLDRALGLYVAAGASRLDTADVVWGVVDAGSRPELRLTTTPSGATLLLVGVPDLGPGPALTVAQHVTLGAEQRIVSFHLAGRHYEVELSFEDPELCDAVVTLRSPTASQVLYRSEEPCDGPHFGIEWAGDLNGDGRLDLVVNLSPKYSVFPAELLMSTDDDATVVRSVARYTHLGL